MTQLDDLNLIAVRIQHEGETRTLNFNASQDCATVQPAAFWPLIRYEDQSDQQYFQWPCFKVFLTSAFIGANDERSPKNSPSRDFNRNRDKTGRRL
jgi:hypothetical protein